MSTQEISKESQAQPLVSARASGQISASTSAGTNMAIALGSEEGPPSESPVDYADMTKEDARAYLMEQGWVVTSFVQAGTPRWKYKAPQVNQYKVSPFYSLCSALEEHNRRIRNNVGMGKATIGVRRKSCAGTNLQNHNTDEINLVHKRLRHSTEEKREVAAKEKPEGVGAGAIQEPNRAAFTLATRTELLPPTLSDLRDVDHARRSSTVTDNRERDDSTVNVNDCTVEPNSNGAPTIEIRLDSTGAPTIELNNTGEAREFLRAAGWKLRDVPRRSPMGSRSVAIDWHYKPPALGTSRPRTLYSLVSAIKEYNQRVRLNNEINAEKRPTIHLCRGASQMQRLAPKAGEGKSACAKMVETRLSGNMPRKPNSSPGTSRTQGEPLSSKGADFMDNVFVTGQATISDYLSKRFEATASTSDDDVQGETFGAFARDIEENDREYLLYIHTLNLKGGQLRVLANNDTLTLIVKGTYCCQSVDNQFSMTGDLSCTITLPGDAMPELATVRHVPPGILHVTLPKRTRTLG